MAGDFEPVPILSEETGERIGVSQRVPLTVDDVLAIYRALSDLEPRSIAVPEWVHGRGADPDCSCDACVDLACYLLEFDRGEG